MGDRKHLRLALIGGDVWYRMLFWHPSSGSVDGVMVQAGDLPSAIHGNLEKRVEAWRSYCEKDGKSPEEIERLADEMRTGGTRAMEATWKIIRAAILGGELPVVHPVSLLLLRPSELTDDQDLDRYFVRLVDFRDWAATRGIVVDVETSARDQADEPLPARTKNNYLRIIMALAMNIEGFDPRHPYVAARAILKATELEIDEKTLATYISDAFALQSKERTS